jgi:zinc protease
LRDAGLVYDAGASASASLDPGTAVVYAVALPDKLAPVQAQMAASIKALQDAPLSAADLAQAQDVLITAQALEQADPAGRNLGRALNELYGLGYDYDTKYPALIMRVTAEEVQALAQTALNSDHAAVLVTQPPAGQPQP